VSDLIERLRHEYCDGACEKNRFEAADALAEVSSAHDAMREAQQFADACGPADALLAQVRRILWKALPDPVSGKRDIGKEILDSVEELKGADSSQCHCGSKFNEYGLCPECDFADEKGQTAHDDQETDNEL
jgi:hypothetical protein